MGRGWVVLGAILLSSCADLEPHLRTETGLGSPVLAAKNLPFLKSGEGLPLTSAAAQVGSPVLAASGFFLDLSVGAEATRPLSGEEGFLLGISTQQRLRYSLLPLQPYLLTSAGFDYLTQSWDKQGTNYGFVLQVGLGFLYPYSPTKSFTLDYRVWHESNGSAIFGTPGPNPGYNSDCIFLGYEVRF